MRAAPAFRKQLHPCDFHCSLMNILMGPTLEERAPPEGTNHTGFRDNFLQLRHFNNNGENICIISKAACAVPTLSFSLSRHPNTRKLCETESGRCNIVYFHLPKSVSGLPVQRSQRLKAFLLLFKGCIPRPL